MLNLKAAEAQYLFTQLKIHRATAKALEKHDDLTCLRSMCNKLSRGNRLSCTKDEHRLLKNLLERKIARSSDTAHKAQPMSPGYNAAVIDVHNCETILNKMVTRVFG